jgi:integrase
VGIERVKVDDDGNIPWTEAGYQFVMKHAPVHLYRMAFLGRACGQRVSDLVKMRPVNLTEDGINLRIGKLRDKPHMVPLTKAQMAEIRSWGVGDLNFFITTPARGKRCSERYLNELWNEWRATPEAAPIRDLDMTIHGLRATAINDRHLDGATELGIAAELGMSVAMVSRYLRFANKVEAGRVSRDRREQARTEIARFVKPRGRL